MTELEKIAYAKSFLDRLANGINPLDGAPVPEGDLTNNVRISRCFFYVSDLLRQMIEAQPSEPPLIPPPRKHARTKKKGRAPFSITREAAEGFIFSQRPLSATAIAKKINFLVPEVREGRMKGLSYRVITEWFLQIGMLEWKENENGRFKPVPSPAGEEIGIMLFHFDHYGKNSSCVLYGEEAQRFIIDHIEVVQVIQASPKSARPRPGDEIL